MNFSLFNFVSAAQKPVLDYVINIIGLIIVPVVVYLLSSVYASQKNEKKRRIEALNNLTLYCKNLLQECLKLKNNELRRKNGLELFISNPLPENFIHAFYLVRTPSLQYELFANDFAFTTSKYCPFVDLIFEINSNLKTVTTFISEFNIQSDLIRNKSNLEQINLAKEFLLQLDSFHHKVNILIYLIQYLIKAIQIYNHYYFSQNIINLGFKGRMKELLDSVNKEIEEKYKHDKDNWLNSFIESIENPEGKKKEIKAKTPCLPTKIKELKERYKKISSNYETIKEKLASIDILNQKAKHYLHRNFLNRLELIYTSIKNIFEILPPDRKTLLSPDEINLIMINLNFITTNFTPALNSIFQFLMLFYFPDRNVEEINFLSPELNDVIDEKYQKHLKNLGDSDFYKFIEAYDDSISNGIPFEISFMSHDENNIYIGIEIIPENGMKNAYIYEFMFNMIQILIDTSNDAYKNINVNAKLFL